MHRLSYISIKNFRACREVSLPLEGITPLVGQNNTGKSTILNAIAWVLKPYALNEEDFQNKQQPIEVAVCIEGISSAILDKIPDQKHHRKAIEPFCRSGHLWIRATANGAGAKAINKEVWDIEHCPNRAFPTKWRSYPTGLPQAVSILLPDPLVIKAMHDIGEDLGKAKGGSTIKGLLDEIMVPILKTHDDLNAALNTIRNILTVGGNNRSDHLKNFDLSATAALDSFFPGLALDLDLQDVDIKEFFKAGDLHVTDLITGDRRRFDMMGTGSQRAIQMALVRYLAETRTSDAGRPARRLLLIDEPELYLHPQGVRRLRQALVLLADVGFQVVFTTHSPMMLSRKNAADTVIVGKNTEAGVITQKPLRQAVQEALDNAVSQSHTLFELGNIAEIYFAELVVLCEGKTDRRLLPLAYEKLFKKLPELDHIAFVSLGSCADIPKALPVLRAMGIKVCAIVDLDFGYTHARSGGLLKKDGDDLINAKKCLTKMQQVKAFTLGGNGLPQNDKSTGWLAADVWAEFALDSEGQTIAECTHQALMTQGVWAWSEGSIEQVTGTADKGEDAIIEQEITMLSMSAEQIEQKMPAFKRCFDWLRDL